MELLLVPASTLIFVGLRGAAGPSRCDVKWARPKKEDMEAGKVCTLEPSKLLIKEKCREGETEMARRYCYKDVLPFTAMVAVECTNVGLNTLFKAASSNGMSNYVFIFYSNAIATLVLLPLAIIFHRKTVLLPPFNCSLLGRICLLGIIGLSAEMMSYEGIEYSSPTLASALSNLTAAFTFILAIIFRMEKINLRSWSSRAKILGTIVSISGALVVVLYKGPTIFFSAPSISFHQSMASSPSQTNWIIGGLFLATEYLLFSIWNILQTQVLKMYPAELIVVFLYNLCITILSAPVCLIAERNPNAWRLRSDIALVTYIYSGFFGSSFSTVVHSWGLHWKGPVYVASFKPLSIAIAAAMGVMFLGDALYLGSVVGVIIISLGFYGVLWGKAKEEEMSEECGFDSIITSSSNSKTALLKNHTYS